MTIRMLLLEVRPLAFSPPMYEANCFGVPLLSTEGRFHLPAITCHLLGDDAFIIEEGEQILRNCALAWDFPLV